MAIKKTQNEKNEKPIEKPTNEQKLKAIIQMLSVQRDTNMTRVYTAILPYK